LQVSKIADKLDGHEIGLYPQRIEERN